MSTLDEFTKPETWSDPSFSFARYDAVYIPGGTSLARHLLEHDTLLQGKISQFSNRLDKERSSTPHVLGVVGVGVAALLNVRHAITDEPILGYLETTGPPPESWVLRGADLSSLVARKAKAYIPSKLHVDPISWYVSCPGTAYIPRFCGTFVHLVRNAIAVSELNAVLEGVGGKLSLGQDRKRKVMCAWDGMSCREKERLDSEGVGKRQSGLVMSQWAWGSKRTLDW